uniref:Uncharacterized protein n=1 Tax=Arundo donax TaxID=35708 RepID=A0A0A9CZ48_ARUDO
MLRLRNHLLPLLRAGSWRPSPLHHRGLLLSTPAPFSLEDYLVGSCGLAPGPSPSSQGIQEGVTRGETIRGALLLPPQLRLQPDAVLALLSGVGLACAEITATVAADALIFRSSLKNIGPRLLALRDRISPCLLPRSLASSWSARELSAPATSLPSSTSSSPSTARSRNSSWS